MDKEYSECFKNIVEFGDIREDELISILQFIGLSPYSLHNDFQTKSSNGMSFVCVTPELDGAYQKFKNSQTVRNINNILSTCDTNIRCNIWFDKKKCIVKEYDLFNFLPKIKNFADRENIIVWEKITPLNSFTSDKVKDIIEHNIIKFLWDIGRAINGLHFNGIYHGDARVDNIGIKDGNFVLFDFDSSKKVTDYNSPMFIKDYNDFIVSIKFNLNNGKNPNRFSNISKFIPDIYSYIFSFIQNNEIFKLVQNTVKIPITVEEMIKIIESSKIVAI